MELREFAERVLFAGTLEEKLRGATGITDEHPGAARPAPEVPGRPIELRFKKTGPDSIHKAGLPRGHLGSDHDRARLLHAFANHELLATELMALVLLRFPDAPAAFRRGVLQTLLDEQEHTRLYLDRLRAIRVEFGEFPVSGYFWRAISAMESPLDFVAGLSLTFEQANLDFARHFAQRFAEAGDAPSARLLEKIHRDEIAHVAHGLKWFRRWKNPAESDWAAFCRQLKYPLSPQRAKGFAVHVESRRAAGLDAAFIAELDVYAQSKGRSPGVFVFNPLAEGYVAGGRAFTPNRAQAQLARDLANLPQFLCRQDDIVLVPKRPAIGFLSRLKQAGFTLPEFVETGDDPRPAMERLATRKLGALRPWAWSPDSLELLAPLVGPSAESSALPFAQLYSKAWSADLLGNWLADEDPAGWLCPPDVVGVATRELGETLAVIERIRRSGHHRIVIKESLGLAGHNAIRLWEPSILDAQRRWIQNALNRGGQLVVEPWLERECDFSLQLEMIPAGLKLIGHTGLINDLKGQFLANTAAPNWARQLPPGIVARLGNAGDVAGAVTRAYHGIFKRLEGGLQRAGYVGPVGVDALIYRDADGRCRLKPIVEINPRYTMGRLTLELMKWVCPGSHGTFRIINRTTAHREGFADFSAYAGHLGDRHPLRLEGEPRTRIRAGVIPLNDPNEAQACLAIWEVRTP